MARGSDLIKLKRLKDDDLVFVRRNQDLLTEDLTKDRNGDLDSYRKRQTRRRRKMSRIQKRRRIRRRNRRLGRSYNPSPEALSAQIWYHGSPHDLKREDIAIINNDQTTIIPGFYLTSLKPAAQAYTRPRDESLKDYLPEGPQIVVEGGVAAVKEPEKSLKVKRGSVYRMRVEVKTPLEREASVEPGIALMVEEVLLRVRSENFPRDLLLQHKEDLLANRENSNEQAIVFLVKALQEIAREESDASVRAREELDLLPQTIINAGWDSMIRTMRSSLSGTKRSALDTAEELILLDPAKQIQSFKD